VETGSNGALLTTHSYWPFGEEMTVTSSSERYRFAGHERDQRTGYDFMHARYYAPMAGQFFSVDPGRDYDFSHPQSFNLYAYVRNNPITQSDPDGRKVALSNVTAEEAAALLEDLERITGLDLEWKDGVLAVAGDKTKAAGGSATARNDLLAAINAEETIFVRGGRLGGALADTPGKASPGTVVPIIRMDFQRIFGIQYSGIPRLTFGVGMIFLHELQHALFGKSDDYDRNDPQGTTVRHMNSIRSELGLPLRAQYEAKEVQRAGIKLRAELNFVRDGKAVEVASSPLR
jgi:RHS repeat-associated protein